MPQYLEINQPIKVKQLKSLTEFLHLLLFILHISNAFICKRLIKMKLSLNF